MEYLNDFLFACFFLVIFGLILDRRYLRPGVEYLSDEAVTTYKAAEIR